ncbi:MAG: PIG-L deacetylase family protein [Planctomycetota bacterium]
MTATTSRRARRLEAIERFDARLGGRVRLLDDAALARPTLVVAPHPDDETLGCGGTIARVRALGAPVVVVACTDGSRSHRHLMDRARLAALREEELRAACATLGVAGSDVHALGHEDGTLESAVDPAAQAIADLLRGAGVERILLPFAGEGIADHLAARRAGLLARARLERPIEVLEYPVWSWHIWPFVEPEVWGIRRRLTALLDPWRASRLARALTVAVDSGDHFETKRRALRCHRSQMEQLVDDPRWLTLADVSGGDWLARCLRPREYFAWSPTPRPA